MDIVPFDDNLFKIKWGVYNAPLLQYQDPSRPYVVVTEA